MAIKNDILPPTCSCFFLQNYAPKKVPIEKMVLMDAQLFTKLLRKILLHPWYTAEKFSKHSFRCGAGTFASSVGIGSHVIKAQGNWRSYFSTCTLRETKPCKPASPQPSQDLLLWVFLASLAASRRFFLFIWLLCGTSRVLTVVFGIRYAVENKTFNLFWSAHLQPLLFTIIRGILTLRPKYRGLFFELIETLCAAVKAYKSADHNNKK